MVAGCKAKQKRNVFRFEQMPQLWTMREVSREHVAWRRHPPGRFPCCAHAGRGEIVVILRSGPSAAVASAWTTVSPMPCEKSLGLVNQVFTKTGYDSAHDSSWPKGVPPYLDAAPLS
jgi:hypothetical protein